MSLKSFNLKESSYDKVLSKSSELWLDSNFFQDGAYITTSGALSEVEHPKYSAGQVFGSKRKNWVWQSGTINVEVGGVPTTPDKILYGDGLVVFDNPVSSGVYCEYSYKHIHVYDVKENKRGSNNGFDVYDGTFRERSLQLPAIGIEIGSHRSDPTQLGSYSRNNKTTILFNVYHAYPDTLDKICNIIYNQVDTYISLFDFENAYRSGAYPLDFDSSLINSSGTYEYLTENFKYEKARKSNAYIYDSEIETPQRLDNHLWFNTVRLEVEAELSMGIV